MKMIDFTPLVTMGYGDGRACERIIRKILHENGYDIKILSEFSPN